MPATFSCEFSAGREDYKACSYHSMCMYHVQSGVGETDSCLQYCDVNSVQKRPPANRLCDSVGDQILNHMLRHQVLQQSEVASDIQSECDSWG